MPDRPLLARQPILDRSQQVYAYELLCRPVPSETLQWQQLNGSSATTEVVIGAIHEIGMALVTGGLPAFVNFTEEWLAMDPPLNPADMVVEILEHIPLNERNLKSVQALKKLGYRIAVDDFTGGEDHAKWLNYADIVKVDLIGLNNLEEAGELKLRYQRDNLLWLAEKVETHEEFHRCREMGYDLFQGFFFSKPVTLYGKRTPDSHLAVMQLLGVLNQVESDFDQIVKVIRNDPQLSYRLMQIANSAAYNSGAPITSLQRAVTLLGLTKIRNWASLLALGKLSDKPAVLQKQSLFRAYLAQNMAQYSNALEPDVAFTLGLFSLLDAMMDTVLEDVCAKIALPDELTTALIKHSGPYGILLDAINAWEKGTPEKIQWNALSLTPSELEICIENAISVSQTTSSLLSN